MLNNIYIGKFNVRTDPRYSVYIPEIKEWTESDIYLRDNVYYIRGDNIYYLVKNKILKDGYYYLQHEIEIKEIDTFNKTIEIMEVIR